MDTTAIPRELTINNDIYVRKADVFAVMPPILQTMVASPYILNAQAYLDGREDVYHDETRFNVLYPQSPTTTDDMAYIVLAGIGSHFNEYAAGDTYFNTNAVYIDDERACVLYDVIHHKLKYLNAIEVLNTAFEHRTMTLDEVCTTFFVTDDPVYGEHFDKDNIADTLNFAMRINYVDAYPMIRIAEFVGVELGEDRFTELYDDEYGI